MFRKNFWSNWENMTWEQKQHLQEEAKLLDEEAYKELTERIMREEANREFLIEQGYCPDCNELLQDESYADESTGFLRVDEFTCKCTTSLPLPV